MKFEWDENKNKINHIKHGIWFEDAIDIFNHIYISAVDDRKNYGEVREKSIGIMYNKVIIVVLYTERDGRKRIISARLANKKEREKYYENV